MNTFIDWETLDFKKRSGKEKLRCPNCDGMRSDKKDKSLAIDHGNGIGKCFYCDALTFRDNKEHEQEYKIPKQDWRNYTKLSDNMVKYIESRKIPQSVAVELGWTEEMHYQPTRGKEVNNLVYNFFEGEKLVNKKYRTGDKKFTQSVGGKPILYNINSIIDAEEIYITEGEMDVAALCAIGIKNVVSVPNGANDHDDYWANSKKYIEGCKKFVIATDNDAKGIILREAIAQRLGRWKCSYIEWEGKDANDDLISGILKESVKNKKRFPVSGTLTMKDLYDDVMDLYDNGLPSTVAPKSQSFGNWRKCFSVMRGQLTVITGIPSNGKSNFNDWYVLNILNDYNLKASWFTPEHNPLSLYQVNIIEKVTGENFWGKSKGKTVPRISKETIAKYDEWADQKIYFTECDNGEFPTWDWLFDKFKEQMYAYGVDIFVIDAFNKVILPPGNEREEISRVLTKLTAFAQVNNVFIFLVAHPTKMHKKEDGTYVVPTLYDVSGTANFRNMTHNGYTVHRYIENESTGVQDGTSVINMKTKFSFQGDIGDMETFKFNIVNGRYYVGEIDNTPLWGNRDKTMVQATLSDAFDIDDLEDEVPF